MIRRKKNKFEKDLADAIPIHTIENDKVVFKDGRVAVGFRISPAEIESWSPGEFEVFNDAFKNQMGILPVGTVIQKTDIYFDQEYEPDMTQQEYFETRLNRHFMYRMMLEHVGFIFISFSDPCQNAKKRNPLNNLLNYVFENPFENIEEVLGIAEGKAEEFINSLNGTNGISFHRLREKELKEVYSRYFTLNFEAAEFNNNVYCDICSTPDGIKVGSKNLWLVTMKGQGTQIFDAVGNHHGVTSSYSYMLANYLQVPHILTTTVWIEDTEKQLSKLDTDKKLNRSLEWMTTQDNEVKAEQIDEFTQGIRSQAGRIVSFNVNVAVYDADYMLIKRFLETTKSNFRAMAGAECIVETWDTLPLYFANCPGNGANNYRWLRTSDEISVKYFNFLSNYKSDKEGDILCDRFRNPLLLNFFNPEFQNQNAIVIGPTGSGKSFTVGYFMVQRFERGARQIIIDVGGSYKNAVTLMNGNDFDNTYFEYDPARPIAFNPFLVQKSGNRYFVDNERVNFLMTLLFKIWQGDRMDKIEQVQKSVIKEVISKYYVWLESNDSHRPCLDSFYDYCVELIGKENEDENLKNNFRYFDIRQFLTTLKPFYKGGVYSSILNADLETDISDYRLVCFDMNKIKGDSMLYPLVSLLITQLALDQIQKFPDEEKYIYMDEAWSMISGTFSEFIEEMFRTIRKAKGSVWIITQGVDEIAKSKIANAILVNAGTKILLKHGDKNMIQKVESVIGLTPQEMEKFTSVRNDPNYREIFVKIGDTSKVFAIEPPAHHSIVLSSKPHERNQLVRLMKKYLRATDAIDEFIEEKLKIG